MYIRIELAIEIEAFYAIMFLNKFDKRYLQMWESFQFQ